MNGAARWLKNAARVSAMALAIALPLFGGYMFTDRVLGAAGLSLLIVLLATAACALGARSTGGGVGAATWPLGGFLAWLVVAAAVGVYLHASLVSLVQMTAYVAMLLVFASLFGDERWRRAGWAAVAAAGALEGILGLRDWTQTVIFQGDPTWRIFGTMYNPNVLAGYVLAVCPAVVVVLAWAWHEGAEDESRPRLALIASGFALLIVAAALLLTGSRAGLLGAVFAVGVLVAAAPTRVHLRRSWIVVGVIALVIVVAVAPPLRNRVVSATQSHSVAFRWHTWLGTAEMIGARPLTGFGPGTYEYAYPRFARVGFTRMAHQTPLQIAAEAGLPALVLVGAAVLMLARRLIGRLGDGGWGRIESAAGLAAMAGVGLQNMADYTWYVPAVGLTLSAVVGLALAGSGDERRAQPRWIYGGIAGLALIALIGCGIGVRAQMLAGRGEADMDRGRYRMAAGWLRQAAEIDPLSAEIRQDLAQAVAVSSAGGPARAVELRLRAAELNPLDAGNYLALSELYQMLGEEQSALNVARRALDVHPNYPRAYVTLGRLQEQIGRDEAALETWRVLAELYESPVGRYRALEEPTDYWWAYAWLALAEHSEAEDDPARAAELYGRAKSLLRGYIEPRRKREKALKELGQWDEGAVAEAERLLDQAERGIERTKGRDEP